jgi:hypothetical protein
MEKHKAKVSEIRSILENDEKLNLKRLKELISNGNCSFKELFFGQIYRAF